MVRLLINSALVIGLIIAILMFAQASYDPVGTLGVDKANEAVSNLKGWQEYEGVEEAFSVMVPAVPQHARETVPFNKESGTNLTYNMYVAEDGDGTTYMINIITYPDELKGFHKENILENIMSEMLNSNPSNKLSKINMSQEANSGKTMNFTLESQDVIIESKAFMEGQKLYVLSVIDTKQNFNQKEYNYFVTSFGRK